MKITDKDESLKMPSKENHYDGFNELIKNYAQQCNKPTGKRFQVIAYNFQYDQEFINDWGVLEFACSEAYDYYKKHKTPVYVLDTLRDISVYGLPENLDVLDKYEAESEK